MTRWLSFHIFHAGDLDRLIAGGVLPLMQQLRGSVDRYFFLRYWNGGPHLRLRIACLGDPAFVNDAVRRELGDYFARHAAASISDAEYRVQCERMERVDTSMHEQMPLHRAEVAEPLQPPDSIQLRRYAFDAARYGGPATRALTEGHFCRSSELAAAMVSATLGRLDARVSLALQFIAATAIAIEDDCDAAATLDQIAGVVESAGNALALDDPRADHADVREIVARVRDRAPIPSQSPAADALVQAWREECAAMMRGLARLRANDALSIPPHLLLIDYLHLLNNRLGVTIGVECHLYRVVAGALAATEVN